MLNIHTINCILLPISILPILLQKKLVSRFSIYCFPKVFLIEFSGSSSDGIKGCEGIGAKDATIFDAHLLVLEDPTLIDEVTKRIMLRKVNAEFAFFEFAEKYTETLSKIEDEYLRERASDMRDVASRAC